MDQPCGDERTDALSGDHVADAVDGENLYCWTHTASLLWGDTALYPTHCLVCRRRGAGRVRRLHVTCITAVVLVIRYNVDVFGVVAQKEGNH